MAEVFFRGFLHFLQNTRRYLRCSHFLTLGFYPGIAIVCLDDFVRHQLDVTLDYVFIKTASDQTLDRKNRVFWICYCLTFCRGTNNYFIISKCNNRRCGTAPTTVFRR